MSLQKKYDHHFHYPWRPGNDVKLLVDSPQIFPAMLSAIDAATEFILFEMYLIESGRIADQFINVFLLAAQRGVRIYLLLDGFGSAGLSLKDKKRLNQKNIQLEYYNPVKIAELRRGLLRNHRKLLLIDRCIMFVGGVGIVDEFDHVSHPELYWRETVLQVVGPCIEDWIDLFRASWLLCSETHLILTPPVQTSPAQTTVIEKNEDTLPAFKKVLGRLTLAKGPGEQEIKKSFINRIRRAKKTVWIATAYFMPSMKIRRALARAARRGIDVHLILPGRYTDHPAVRHASRRFYLSLLNAGVCIYEYQPRFMHQKVLLCDAWVSIGSSNLDRWNFRLNLEANQELEDKKFAQQVHAMLQQDKTESQHIQLSDWKRRPFRLRLLQWFWGAVDIWLDSYIRKQLLKKKK